MRDWFFEDSSVTLFSILFLMKAQRHDYTLYRHKMCQITVLHMLIRNILFGAFKGLSLQTSEAIGRSWEHLMRVNRTR